MERKERHVALFHRIYTASYYSTSPPPPCVGAARVLFSRGKYTHPSIILFLTVFHYCLRKKGSNAQTVNKSHLRRLITLKQNSLVFQQWSVSSLSCLAGTRKVCTILLLLDPLHLKKKARKKTSDFNNSGIQRFDDGTMCIHPSPRSVTPASREKSRSSCFIPLSEKEGATTYSIGNDPFVMSQRGQIPFPGSP